MAKTIIDSTSCIIFNWGAVNCPCPNRLAGTWKTYSTKAMSQLIIITVSNGALLNFK